MKILFITSAHNSLSQRLLIELTKRGHVVPVCVATSDNAMRKAVAAHAPELIVAPHAQDRRAERHLVEAYVFDSPSGD